VSASAINRLLRRRRRRLAAFAVVLALGAAVAAHHMPVEHIGLGAMVICLAVLPVLAPAVAHVVEALLPRVRQLRPIAYAPCRLLAATPLPRARSSPVATVVLRR
jgi:hypothetical protein